MFFKTEPLINYSLMLVADDCLLESGPDVVPLWC
ncbi:Uncharacterised protein [Pragia fontium]|nr:Uncharacterised protein [Pragia fontium]VEJ56260.1 Uncharacterised protein [Pragia fontium]